jgi:transglutaminase/protease-like cytokinesis protein 3
MKGPSVLFCLILVVRLSTHAQITDFHNTDFKKADSVAALYPKHSLKDIRALALKLTQSLQTEQEKFRAIYKWTCENIENDHALATKTERKRQQIKNQAEFKAWNRKFTSHIFKQLQKNKRTVCSGYAYLLKELALHAGITCRIINGYGRTAQSNIGGTGVANHSWNAVQLDNKWYLCDATWSSGAIDTEKSSFVKNYDNSYFLADPTLFIRNHYPLDSTWTLLQNEQPSLTEFLNGPLVYSNIYKYKITQLLPETFNITVAKNELISFQFAKDAEPVIQKTALIIKRSSAVNSVNVKPYQNSSGLFCIDHTFTARGLHIVHILLNNDYIVTYKVNVL